jgi:hypothetical protein
LALKLAYFHSCAAHQISSFQADFMYGGNSCPDTPNEQSFFRLRTQSILLAGVNLTCHQIHHHHSNLTTNTFPCALNMPRFNGSLQIIAVNSSDASLIRVHLIDLRLDQLGARPVSIDQIVNSPGRRSTTLMQVLRRMSDRLRSLSRPQKPMEMVSRPATLSTSSSLVRKLIPLPSDSEWYCL